MELLILSTLFSLIFWGGVVIFIGDALVALFSEGQENVLRSISVFHRRDYFEQSLLGKMRDIYMHSSMRTKMSIIVLCCAYAVLSIELIAIVEIGLHNTHAIATELLARYLVEVLLT